MLKRTVARIVLALLLIVCANSVLLSFFHSYLAQGADVGRQIDLFSQRGGTGENVSSSPFETGERIVLFALITYNQEPVRSVLVEFQVNNPQDSQILVSTGITNDSGYATFNFTLSQASYPVYPSLWEAFATSSVGQKTVQDIMPFYVLLPPVIVPDDYQTIQEAVNHASEGEMVYVRAGTYYEHVIVNKTVSLRGENRDTTFIDGSNNGDLLDVTADNVSITGFTLRNAGPVWCAVEVRSSFSWAVIWNNSMIDNGCGVRVLSGSLNATISGNKIFNTQPSYADGIRLLSTGVLVVGNIVINESTGIGLDGASGITVRNNTFTNNYIGIEAGNSSCNNMVFENVFSDNNYGVHADLPGGKFFHNNFINNNQQAASNASGWDDSYPSGGNYWSDYTGADLLRGPFQNETGSDGIGDTPCIIDANNTDRYPLMKPYTGPHDIGITNLTTSKTVIGRGYSANLYVKIINYGINAETFNVTVCADLSVIATLTDFTLAGRNSTTVTVNWNTANFTYGNYPIAAEVTAVRGETDTTDNTRTLGIVKVTISGDVNGDWIVDTKDLSQIGHYWRKTVPPAPANLDINGDGIIDIRDLGIIGKNWLKHA